MNEIQNIDTLTTEILILKQQTAQNIIEIGKRLITVKESLPHGEWGNWLKEKVDFTDRTAQRFMKAANEFSNPTTLSDLPKSKIFALLELPPEEREEFVKSKPVNDMTTRELQQAIKEKQELEKKLKSISKESKVEHSQNEKLKKELEAMKDKNKEELVNREVEIENLKSHIKAMKKQLDEAQASGNNEEADKLQVLLQESERAVEMANNRIDDLERQLKEKPIDVITAEPQIIEKVVEKIPDEVEKELQELRDKLKSTTPPNESEIKFKVKLSQLIDDFKGVLELIVSEQDAERQGKYKAAAKKFINKIEARL